MNAECSYVPLNKQEFSELWEKHKKLIQGFIFQNSYDAEKIYVNEKVLTSIIVKVDQRRQYFKYFHKLDMSEYKEAALNSFWYIKLHPLNIGPREFAKNPPQEYDSINEKLALYIIITTLRALLHKKGIPQERLDQLPIKYFSEIIYSFTYRDLSKESLIALVESIATFLGLNPYQN